MATINSFPIPTRAATKADVGLGNVDNTADSAKPVSTAQAAVFANKQDKLVSGSNIKTVNGQSLLGSGNVAISGGSANVQTGALTASATDAPNAQGVIDYVAAQVAGITAGAIAPISAAFSAALPLDKVQGTVMPTYAQSGNLTLTVGASPVEHGWCDCIIDGDGTSSTDISAFIVTNGYIFNSAKRNIISALYNNGVAMLAGVAVDKPTVGPTFTSQSAPGGINGAAYSYQFVATDAISYAVHAGDSLPTGLTLNTATGTISGTLTALGSFSFRIDATNDGGTTVSNMQTVEVVALGQVSGLQAGTVTPTSQVLSWSALDGATFYTVEYKKTTDGTWTVAASNVSGTTYTVTALAASTSYDYRVSGGNPSGSGAYSLTVTKTTQAGTTGGSITSNVVYATGAPGEDLDGYEDWVCSRNARPAWVNRKANVNLISVWSEINVLSSSHNNQTGRTLTFTGGKTDEGYTATSPSTNCYNVGPVDATQDCGVQFTVPAGTGLKKVRVMFQYYNDNTASKYVKVVAALSDASATPVEVHVSTGGNLSQNRATVEFTYNAASAGQTLNVKTLLPGNSGTASLVFQGCTYGAA